jgi:hypothetical protein
MVLVPECIPAPTPLASRRPSSLVCTELDPFSSVLALDELGVFHGDTCERIVEGIWDLGGGASEIGVGVVDNGRTVLSQARLATILFSGLLPYCGTVAVSLP